MADPSQPHASFQLVRSLTGILGRSSEIEAVRRLLVDDNLPLVTLTGPGGVGKTRLAQEIGHILGADYADGARVVDLSPVQSSALVLDAVAQSLGVRVNAGRSVFSALTAVLHRQQCLLLLDNFEHLLGAAPDIAALLAECPAVQILATSRAPLRVRGERVFLVEPLQLPETARTYQLDALARIPAVALLIERSQDVNADLALTETNAPAIAAICQRLDGLPLAIELAAPRLRVLSPEALLTLLDNRLRAVGAGPRDAPVRHRSLSAAIAWSYDLLDAATQSAFRGLSVFVGDFDIALAATALDVDFESMSRRIELLHEQSLLQRHTRAREDVHFAMLETVREFAAEVLRASDEALQVRVNHARFFLARAEETRADLFGPRMTEMFERQELDFPNMCVALDFFAETGDSERELWLACMLSEYWLFRGHVAEGIERFTAAFERAGAVSPMVHGRALSELGWHHYTAGNMELARQLGEASIPLTREGGHPFSLMLALHGYAITIGYGFQRWDEAIELLQEAELSQPPDRPIATGTLGDILIEIGETDRGIALLEESLRIFIAHGHRQQPSFQLLTLGIVASAHGDIRGAAARFAESLRLLSQAGAYNAALHSLTRVALLAAQQSLPITTAWLLGMAARFTRIMGVEFYPTVIETVRQTERDTRRQLGDDRYSGYFEGGFALSTTEAIAEAIAVADRFAIGGDIEQLETRWLRSDISIGIGSHFETEPLGLTARERDVLCLMARRQTDAEIADQLFISYRTVTTHVARIIAKLGARNRRDAAATAARHGLIETCA